MIDTKTIQLVDYNFIINRFCQLSNWVHYSIQSYSENSGRILFFPTLKDNIYQYEQNWIGEYYCNLYKEITHDIESLKNVSELIDNKVLYIPLDAIIQWLVIREELIINDTTILVKN